jgi:hypothetical protein
MSLGTKLQGVYAKVNTKLGFQGGTVTLVLPRTGVKLHFTDTANDYSTKLELAAGLVASYASAREVAGGGGILELGDLKLEIPAHLVSKETIEDTGLELLYDGLTWKPYSVRPMELVSNVAVRWQVMARRQTG